MRLILFSLTVFAIIIGLIDLAVYLAVRTNYCQ